LLTVVAVLGGWRRPEFRRELKRQRREGHVIEVEDSGGLCERRVTVTARIDIRTRLLGNS
jgi:hypothetical protein